MGSGLSKALAGFSTSPRPQMTKAIAIYGTILRPNELVPQDHVIKGNWGCAGLMTRLLSRLSVITLGTRKTAVLFRLNPFVSAAVHS